MISTKNCRRCRLSVEKLELRYLLTTYTPANSAAFVTALNNAQLGDTIILNAGTTYSTNGGFILKNKTSGTGWITIQSSNLASLPAGVRVSPTDAVNMTRIQAPGSN